MTKGDTGRWGLMLTLINDFDRGERGDPGVITGVWTGVTFWEGSGELNENIDPQEDSFGDGSPSSSAESLEVVVKLYSGEMFEDEGNDLGDKDDAGDILDGEGQIVLEFFREYAGDFKLIREGEVLVLNSLIAGELQGELRGDRSW